MWANLDSLSCSMGPSSPLCLLSFADKLIWLTATDLSFLEPNFSGLGLWPNTVGAETEMQLHCVLGAKLS